MLMVLGRPSSGRSTFLKTVCGELRGLKLHEDSIIHHNGLSMEHMQKGARLKTVYNHERDYHMPELTVRQTLEFAAAARTSAGLNRSDHIQQCTKVALDVFNLSTIENMPVGSEYHQTISNGERKRVSIAETALSLAPIQAWNHCTRGLDAKTVSDFVSSLRISANITYSCHIVSLDQASEAIYGTFDKVILLYEGRQVFYGRCDRAKDYFIQMGWWSPPSQNTADFLIGITNPQIRQARQGMGEVVPRTPREFEEYWKRSADYRDLRNEVSQFQESQTQGFAGRSPWRKEKYSAYVITPAMQIGLCTKRACQRVWNNKSPLLTIIIGRIAMAFILGSVYYGTPDTTAGFQSRGSILFFAVAINTLMNTMEITSYHNIRAIVQKQAAYAFVHPFAEAVGRLFTDIPIKLITGISFNVVLYFLAGLRREPSQFFIFLLFVFVGTLTMSSIFRAIAVATRSTNQAMTLVGALITIYILYMGFVIPLPIMKPWFSWIRWLNPVFYVYEALIINEFHGREFVCSQFIPDYENLIGNTFVCSMSGALTGEKTVLGDNYIFVQYGAAFKSLWRNFGIIISFWVFFLGVSLFASEFQFEPLSAARVTIFRRFSPPARRQCVENQMDDWKDSSPRDTGSQIPLSNEHEHYMLKKQSNVFTWKNICYDITRRGTSRRLLDNCSGWAKPGTLTAIMGVSGSGKTTLLKVLAQYPSDGTVSGTIQLNGRTVTAMGFRPFIGFVQQEDIHLPTATVREALRFTTRLRRPDTVSEDEKYAYVEEVISMLHMEEYADAVIGLPGTGLDDLQRILLGLGLELATKPAFLFLDDPTRSLDTQSSLLIYRLLRRLSDAGLAVISTVHQPTASVFHLFDHLLLLENGGRTVYFGETGHGSSIVLNYFALHTSQECEETESPAEYLLRMSNMPTVEGERSSTWQKSPEARHIQDKIDHVKQTREVAQCEQHLADIKHRGFALPFYRQLFIVTHRVFQQYWRDPAYIYGKLLMAIATALLIGFSSFKPTMTLSGYQSVLYGILNLMGVLVNLIQQTMPNFILQRSLYEVREQPCRLYAWPIFILANIIVEIPYQIFFAFLVWVSFYFPIFGVQQTSQQQGLMLLFLIQLCIFAMTLATLIISALPDADTVGATFAFIFMVAFNGVLQPPGALPGFWIFMYRLSPLTYLISGITATGLHSRPVHCSSAETNIFDPPSGMTCDEYLASYLETAAGKLYNPSAIRNCEYCPFSYADQLLGISGYYYNDRWRNWGIGWAYVVFNILGSMLLYYIFRVRRCHPISGIGHLIGNLFAHMPR
ncbi:ABC-2 type transporter-domain-containing protein [Talaromyces proteolyticus]|uniref:ABC-2 type transporter-domain-containing protein n=1 Tax=Talaromyces proteolyticus TaxID=1131652 RepID=A0AAD4KTM6_9EURO|nr:ABC-2 type transporter-domain-containing protein [Talaromyces proteolyticus]KAH8695660.1 ABC-2 type transporter-domain-containing protein [Talaromyces proteolyticus]